MEADVNTSGQPEERLAEPPLEGAVEPPAEPVAYRGMTVPGLPVADLPDAAAFEDDDAEEVSVPENLEGPVKSDRAEAPRVHPGSRRTGVVVAVGPSGVIVSFGAKVEGLVPLEDFDGGEGGPGVEPGQDLEVVVERLGAPGSYARLSHRRVREAAAWKQLEASHAQNVPVEAKVVGRVKGGLRVNVGVAAFLPASQVDMRPTPNLDEWVGRTLEVVVVECNRRRSNAVVSRSELLKARHRELQRETLKTLEIGQPATGVVKNIAVFGVFVDLGGIDGLIKLNDLSYGRVGNPANLFKPGDEVTAKVLRIDRKKERVALSLREMQPDPWATIEERYPVGTQVQGRVTSVKDYGAFVELEPAVEGLIHVSEITWSRRMKHPSKTFAPGAETEAMVIGVKPKDRRISLSFKRLTPDPWDAYGESLKVGHVVEGVVRRIENYGLFVEVVEGIEGLVHSSDLSWDSRVRDPRAVAKKGQQIDTVILHVDTEKRRLSLGIKQLEPDAWDTVLSQYTVGDTVAGVVRRIKKFGSFVELAPGVEGLCHVSQSPRGSQALRSGLRYYFTILDVNEAGRRIALRCQSGVPVEDDEAE